MPTSVFGLDILDEALAEILHEVTFYEVNGGARVRAAFVAELERVARRIVEEPRSFPVWPRKPGVRRVMLHRFPFALGFVPSGSKDEPALIVAAAHHRRRPGYWFTRSKTPARRRRR